MALALQIVTIFLTVELNVFTHWFLECISRIFLKAYYYVQRGRVLIFDCTKGPVKKIEWVKIALLFLHVMSKMFMFMFVNLSG